MPITITRAEQKDAAGVLRLLLQIAEYHYRGRPDLFNAGAAKYSEADFAAMLKDAEKPMFVARDEEDTVVGYALCKLQSAGKNPAMTDRRWLYIDDLCVDESCRGKQIGKQLYEAAIAFAKETGIYGIKLNVWEFNADAIRFYENRGMKTQSRMMEQIL